MALSEAERRDADDDAGLDQETDDFTEDLRMAQFPG